jgi:DNA-binding winged helix-turn-helix (wHTH) protein
MRYSFAAFTLDAATRQLSASGAERHLSPKAFDLLVFLVSNRSRAVAKGELQQHLWPETFVEETNLAGLVAEVRRALDDPASSPRYVRTVYGFGYRFVAEVTVQEGPLRPAPSRARCYLISTQSELMLMEGANVVGRAPDATIQLDSPGVSRHHARIVVSGAEATLEDVSSKNGTYLDGTRITSRVPLSDGSQIRIGTVLLTFRVTTPTAPTATAAAE